jgi:hypothetical protein
MRDAMSEAEETPTSNAIWCLVANVAEEQFFGEEHEVRRGTKHFSANTKIYCFPGQWGDGYEKIKVIGHHRGSPKLITMVMPRKRLTNWRAKLVYKPYVIREMGNVWDKDSIERMIVWLKFAEQVERARILGFDKVEANDALLYAADLGRVEEIYRALERGADINARGINELTPLMVALSSRRLEVVQVLIDCGADKMARTSSGTTAFSIIQKDWYWNRDSKSTILRSLGLENASESE